jgi:hypothetical protein
MKRPRRNNLLKINKIPFFDEFEYSLIEMFNCGRNYCFQKRIEKFSLGEDKSMGEMDRCVEWLAVG